MNKWNEIQLDQQCLGNKGCKMWITADGQYAKKGRRIEGKWREVIYRLNKGV